jgi:hypothetical protein
VIGPLSIASQIPLAIPQSVVAAGPSAASGASSAFADLVQELGGISFSGASVSGISLSEGVTPVRTMQPVQLRQPVQDERPAKPVSNAPISPEGSRPGFSIPGHEGENAKNAPERRVSPELNAKNAPERRVYPELDVKNAPAAAEPDVKNAPAKRSSPEPDVKNAPAAAEPETKNAPVRRMSTARSAQAPAPAPVQVQVPFIFIPVPLPAPPPLPRGGETGGSAPIVAEQPESREAPERTPPSDVALQVNIKIPNEVPVADPIPVKPEPARISFPETPTVPASVSAAVPTAAVNIERSAPATARPVDDAPASHAPVPAEPVTKEPNQQPLKSLSLEFAPDGAGDVRLRVSERAGEVHISLHSSDASLSGKLHEGVHDLVGSLSRAGYDAEAWTPGQGQPGGNQRQQERQQQPSSPKGSGTEDFAGIFEEQPKQENS